MSHFDGRTAPQRSWPWLAGLVAIGTQGLSFTGHLEHLGRPWQVAFLGTLVTSSLASGYLAVMHPESWGGLRTRWLRAAALASLTVWLLLAVLTFLDGLVAGLREGAAMDTGSKIEADLSRPSSPELPRASERWPLLGLWIGLVGAGTFAFKRQQDVRDEADRQRLNAGLARDAALRAKLAPHFIFNTLNTLHAQIEHDPRGAQATTERLAQLFRQVIDVSERSTISLKEELALVEGYLGIEKARLGERLRVVIDVPEELESLTIPPLSLQVLVENAVKHGVAPLEAGGLVRVSARRDVQGLSLTVEDPGDGQGAAEGTGTALATLRSRLACPEDLELGPWAGGFRANLRWRTR